MNRPELSHRLTSIVRPTADGDSLGDGVDGYRDIRLKHLSTYWNYQRGRSALEKYTFSLFQTSLSGVSFLYVVGAGVLFVSVYLCFHIAHLGNIARSNILLLRHCAFMPISLPKVIWAIELGCRTVLLPGLAFVAMTVKFPVFRAPGLSWSLFGLAMVALLCSGGFSLMRIADIRTWMPAGFFLGRRAEVENRSGRPSVASRKMRGRRPGRSELSCGGRRG